MPEKYVGISNDAGYKLFVDEAGSVNSIPAAPAGSLFYFYSLADLPGVVAANNFLSVFNPLTSPKILVFYQAQIVSYSVGEAQSANSMLINRTSAASGGTQVAASTMPRFLTTWDNPVAEVRHANPTVTTVSPILVGVAPVISVGVGASASSTQQGPSGASFVCLPGQGLVMRTAAGDVDQRWNLSFTWAELPI